MKSTSSGYINAYFGFENLEIEDVEIPAGEDNKFAPPPEGRSQTEVFMTGRSRHFPMAAFYTPFTASGSISWILNGYEVSASDEDNECDVTTMAFQILLIQNTVPSQTVVDSIKEISMRMLNYDEELIDVYSEMDSAARYKIVVNMTQAQGSSSSPLAAMMTLFGSNEVYSEYMSRVRSLGVNPSEITTMETGNEKVGTPVNGTPTSGGGGPGPSPSNSTTPLPPIVGAPGGVIPPIAAPFVNSSSTLYVQAVMIFGMIFLSMLVQ